MTSVSMPSSKRRGSSCMRRGSSTRESWMASLSHRLLVRQLLTSQLSCKACKGPIDHHTVSATKQSPCCAVYRSMLCCTSAVAKDCVRIPLWHAVHVHRPQYTTCPPNQQQAVVCLTCTCQADDKSQHMAVSHDSLDAFLGLHVNDLLRDAGGPKEEPYPPTELLLEKLQQVLEKADMEARQFCPCIAVFSVSRSTLNQYTPYHCVKAGRCGCIPE